MTVLRREEKSSHAVTGTKANFRINRNDALSRGLSRIHVLVRTNVRTVHNNAFVLSDWSSRNMVKQTWDW